MNPKVAKVLDRIKVRSQATREQYIKRMEDISSAYPSRKSLSCGNLAHGFAACGIEDKKALKQDKVNVAIVSAYNEMLSAHESFHRFPEIIKEALGIGGGRTVRGTLTCDGHLWTTGMS